MAETAQVDFRQKNCAAKMSAVIELVWAAKISEP
jgi:hypothetical protein